ncbi:MAG: hypothetical protein FIB01_08645 [Gemmatimonadetes bacterium]|nr:hypothetical protein [Gemmatimonadota bacterium]
MAARKVISRTSVMGYAGSDKNIKDIAKELAAGSIVEGSVQVVGQRLRVNAQLIDAATDGHLWAERYDRTLDDAFAVQSEIAQKIVGALGARLAAPERTAISLAPTANAEAYRLYLQGQDYWRRPGRNRRDFEIAQGLYEQAVALDSGFALAHAALSQVHGMLQWFRYDPSPERLVQQRREAETALRLAPELPQAHRAMAAWRYFGERNWQAALAEYRVAAEGLPGDAETWEYMGYAQRRLGNWQEVFDVLKRVIALDPRNANALYDLGGFTSVHIRRYQDALDWYGRALALAPDALSILLNRAVVPLLWQGSLDSLDAVLQRIPAGTDLGEGEGTSTAWKAKVLLWERRPEQLLALVNGQGVFEAYEFYLPATLYQGWAQQLLGNRPAARAAFESARARLDSALTVLPDDWRVHAARGLALAGLGRISAAEGEARWLQQSDVYRADAYLRPYLAEDRALILAGCGQGAAAVTEIEHVLAGPSSTVSVYTLRLDPRLDPIRNRPDFQALLRRYARPAPVR